MPVEPELFFDPKYLDIDTMPVRFGDASGIDVRADIQEPVVVDGGTIVKIPTGVYSVLPPSMFIMVCSRSGLAAKGIIVANAPGIVDADYRGEIGVLLYNTTTEPFTVEPSNRIAQLVVMQGFTSRIGIIIGSRPAEDTNRGAGGFGSTGVK